MFFAAITRLVIGLLFLFSSVSGQDKAVPKHLEDLLALVKNLEHKNTSYRHRNTEVDWPKEDSPAVCHTDCSGLVNALFERSYGLDEEKLKTWLGSRRPVAQTYYKAIVAENRFQRIQKIGDLRLGDLIAIKYETGADNTGHTMFVVESPKPLANGKPEVPDTVQWQVTIVDCSSSGHGPTDTRRQPDGKYHPGLGRGIFRIYADKEGNMVGYTWSVYANSSYHDGQSRHLVVGRFKTP